MRTTNHPHLLLLLPLLAVLMFTSCSRHSAVWPQLLEAEQLLETDLPSAGAMIDSLDATSLEGEDAALYAILKTQADWKRYLPLTSDSLPRLATDYYGTPYRKNYHAAMAWYSLGCYYTEQKDDAGAIESYLRAKDLYPDTLVRYYALCEQNLGKHYLYHKLFRETFEFLSLFKNHPECKSDPKLAVVSDYLLGLAYTNTQDFRAAQKCFHDVLNNPSCSQYYYCLALIQQAKILYDTEHDLANSLSYLNLFFRTNHSKAEMGPALVLKGDLCQELNLLDSAYYYYRLSLQQTDDVFTQCHACQQLSNVFLQFHVDDSVSTYFARYDSLNNVIHYETSADEILSIRETHDSMIQDGITSIRKMKLLAAGIMVFLACILLLLIRYRTVSKKAPAARYLMAISSSRQTELKALVCLDGINEAEVVGNASGDESSSVISLPMLQVPEALDELQSVIRQERLNRITLYRKQCEESPYFKQLISLSPSQKSKNVKRTLNRDEVIQDLLDRTMEFTWDLRQGNPLLSPADILFCVCRILVLPEEAVLFLLGSPSHRALISRKSRIKDVMDPLWFEVIFE